MPAFSKVFKVSSLGWPKVLSLPTEITAVLGEIAFIKLLEEEVLLP